MTNDYYSFRCKHWQSIKINIKIAKTELTKISKHKENQSIKYTKTSKEKIHLCENYNKETKEIRLKEYTIKSDFLKSIFISNIEKPFLFHFNNIRINKSSIMDLTKIKRRIISMERKIFE